MIKGKVYLKGIEPSTQVPRRVRIICRSALRAHMPAVHPEMLNLVGEGRAKSFLFVN